MTILEQQICNYLTSDFFHNTKNNIIKIGIMSENKNEYYCYYKQSNINLSIIFGGNIKIKKIELYNYIRKVRYNKLLKLCIKKEI